VWCFVLTGCEGIAAINTIRSVIGINLDTLRPEPSVEGYSTPGGYSYRAVKPIALERVMSISSMLQAEGFRQQGVSLSGIGGVETGADAAEFILLGADTVQVCAAGSGCVRGEGGLALPTIDGVIVLGMKHCRAGACMQARLQPSLGRLQCSHPISVSYHSGNKSFFGQLVCTCVRGLCAGIGARVCGGGSLAALVASHALLIDGSRPGKQEQHRMWWG